MRPEDRENERYSEGAQNPIGLDEQLMFSLLPPLSSDQRRLLDVGCGIGTISLKLQKRGFQVTGVDFSEVAINKCLEKELDAILSDVDRDGLQFPDGSFDVVWAGDVVEHVFDPIFLFEEMSRVLDSEGYLLLSTPNYFTIYTRWKVFVSGRSIQSNAYRRLKQCKHHTLFSWELLDYMLSQAGFVVDGYLSVAKLPKIKQEKVTSNRTIGMLFGRIFVVRACKGA
jgi:2-polyprenyl-3-methyl-5-hydroxy-6-metoxy-1,4-benzoquinol methylase